MNPGVRVAAMVLLAGALFAGGQGVEAQAVPSGAYVQVPADHLLAGPYPLVDADVARSCRVVPEPPVGEPRPLWVRLLSQRVLHTPIIAPSGQLYVGGERGLTALDAHGKVLWEQALGALRFSPTLLASGDLLVVLEDGGLLTVSRGGAVLARLWDLTAQVPPLPLVDGRVALLDRRGEVHVVTPRGERHARVKLRQGGPRQLTRAVDGSILAASGTLVTRFTADGSVLGEVDAGAAITAGPVAAGERFYLATGSEGHLHAFSLSGRPLLSAPVRRGVGFPSLCLAADGNLWMPRDPRELLSLSPGGEARFAVALDGDPGPLLLAGGDVALLVTSVGTLYAVERDGRIRFRVPVQARGLPRPVLAADGTIYIASRDGRLSAWR
ncbi:MAG: PQQ-binding-like beta-propeller repeat protein [Myxococcales bacterium]|nr:PQQ-binding-like beta-propeller repeat protein [Myxococcales bacterium]